MHTRRSEQAARPPTHLTATLFGRLTLTAPNGEAFVPRGRNIRALLVFLLLDSSGSHTREQIAALIWPDLDPPRQRCNLRVALSQLRKQLAELLPGPILETGQRHIAFTPEGAIRSDAAALEHALNAPFVDPLRIPTEPPLADLSAPSDSFAEWLDITRQRLLVTQLSLLERGARQAMCEQSLTQARGLVERMLELDPLNQASHQLMAEILAAADAPAAATTSRQGGETLVAQQLGIEPEGAQGEPATARPVVDTPPIDNPVPRQPRSWFPPAQRRKLEHFFTMLDEDGDGIITWESFTTKVENLKTPFQLSAGDRRLIALEQAFADTWSELRLFAKDRQGRALDLDGWFRWVWSVQQRIARASDYAQFPAAARNAGYALFRLADQDGDEIIGQQEFCRWLAAWTPHMEIDPIRAFRRLSGERRCLHFSEAMQAAQFKFSAFASSADALYGLLE
ncbi:MAG: EF-hand domain-containing protein [Pseudomonadota bacterium]